MIMEWAVIDNWWT